MSDWQSVLCRPDAVQEDEELEGWFDDMAGRLLNGSRLLVGDRGHRFVEIEFYYCGDIHPDPFTHRDPLQLECGRWYFHRTRGTYRSGSFKGIDLTFGDGKAFGGVLIRSIEAEDGTLIDGPSLCVDYLLRTSGYPDVASLDRAIAGRDAWDTDSPLVLEEAADEEREVYRSARVGLSLKKAVASSQMPRYVMRPYRYLTEPRRVSKGKAHVVLALHAQGETPEAIHKLTGCPRASIQRYIADFESGRREKDFSAYLGVELNPEKLSRLHGTWHARMKGGG
jgi:3-methyladenine DNA glycosylase Mpg